MSSRQLHLIQSVHEMAIRSSYGHDHGLFLCLLSFQNQSWILWPQGKSPQFYPTELVYDERLQAWQCLPSATYRVQLAEETEP